MSLTAACSDSGVQRDRELALVAAKPLRLLPYAGQPSSPACSYPLHSPATGCPHPQAAGRSLATRSCQRPADLQEQVRQDCAWQALLSLHHLDHPCRVLLVQLHLVRSVRLALGVAAEAMRRWTAAKGLCQCSMQKRSMMTSLVSREETKEAAPRSSAAALLAPPAGRDAETEDSSCASIS